MVPSARSAIGQQEHKRRRVPDCETNMSSRDEKVGVSDPAVLDGKAVAQQIKGTPGITG